MSRLLTKEANLLLNRCELNQLIKLALQYCVTL